MFVQFVDFRMGADSGYIRFEEPEGAQKARAAAVLAEEGGLVVKNYVATLEPVTGRHQSQLPTHFPNIDHFLEPVVMFLVFNV